VNTEGAIKNVQSRKTGKIGTQDDDKQNKNTTQRDWHALNLNYCNHCKLY